MNTLHIKIIGMLKNKQLKPNELLNKLGISRQTLHKHLKLLVEAKKLQKHGAGPHVTYSLAATDVMQSRVRADYTLCKTMMLPEYLERYANSLEKFVQAQRRMVKNATNAIPDFQFLLDSAAVYSSNIEGNTLDLNSFLNSRMSPKKHRPKEAQEIEDLVSAYNYARKNELNEQHMLRSHKILSNQFVAKSRQGTYRREPVGVFSQSGLEYMAVEPHLVDQEMRALFAMVSELLHEKLTRAESFFWAAWLHLMIALIHPFSDGNGRTARLCEKWFLHSVLGERSIALPSEECYWKHRSDYYAALKLGANYWESDMSKAFGFFALLPEALVE